MRTGFNWGTGFDAAESNREGYVELPVTHGFQFDRMDRDCNRYLYRLAAVEAEIDYICPVLRGDQDPGFNSLYILRQCVDEFDHRGGHVPRWAPFMDTGALPWIVERLGASAFDFRNDAHLQTVYAHMLRPFYRVFAERPDSPVRWERTPSGRLLVWWWGAQLPRVLNPRDCGRMLDYVNQRLIDDGYGPADHIVDHTWGQVNCYGQHSWFNPPKLATTVTTYRGVTCAVGVPGFHDHKHSALQNRVIHRRDGQTLRDVFMRWTGVDYGLLESLNNIEESSGFYPVRAVKLEDERVVPVSWGTEYLNIVRDHVRRTSERVPPAPEPQPGGDDMDAVTAKPLLGWVLFDALMSGEGEGTVALRGRLKDGEFVVDPEAIDAKGRPTVLSLQPDGRIQLRSVGDPDFPVTIPGAWESGKVVNDDKIVFRNGRHMVMYGLMRGV